MNNLNNKFKEFIKKTSLEQVPKEACGFIIDDKIVACQNISPFSHKHFLISKEETDFCRNIGNIVSLWHSHPEGTSGPSQADIYLAEKFKISSVIYVVKTDEFYQYNPIGFEMPYIGREYYFKVLDCLTLVIDYYNRELNIDFPYIEHPALEEANNWRTFPETEDIKAALFNYMTENGFIKAEKPRKHDVLVIKPEEAKVPCHFAVCLGEDRFLHQLSETSEISHYGRYWKSKTNAIYRHKVNI